MEDLEENLEMENAGQPLTPEEVARIAHISQRLADNPREFLGHLDHVSARAESQSAPFHQAPSQTPAPTISPEIIATITATVMAAMRNQNPIPATSTPTPTVPSRSDNRSEKLPDIPEYDGDMEKLDAWEQLLIQRMHVNHDRYPTDLHKIAYAESRLTISKKAHNLMNRYRTDGLSTIRTFKEWRARLRECCGNRFEEEDARTYLRDTLKQGSMSFDEYFNLFSQKKDKSHMEEASLIDAMKRNVSYSTQSSALNWRKSDGSKAKTFHDHVQMWSETDWDLRQLKHRLPRQANSVASTTTQSLSSRRQTSNTPSQGKSSSSGTKSNTTPFSPFLPSSIGKEDKPETPANITDLPIGDPMDLSSAIIAVKGKSLKVPGVKKICDDYRLCYYCKQSHPGMTAKTCPNKGIALRSGQFMEIEDDQSVIGGVIVESENE